MSSAAAPSVPAPLPPLTRRGAVALLLVFAAIWFSNLDYRRLVHPDEGRYAEVPREMAATGDWLTPRLNGIKYFEKPALQYWITAAAYSLFGVHHWTARVWPALAGFLGVLFIGYVGLRLGGPLLGLYSAAVLGGTAWHVLNAHILTLDAGVAFWMNVGIGSLFIAQRDDATPAEERGWMLAAWAALALAVLSKGLIGLVLPGATIVLYSLLQRDWSLWRRLHPVGGTLLLLAIAAPWFVAVSLRNREFFDFFFIHEHFTRFLTHEARREGAWWYFVPVFCVGILPWLTVFLWTAPRMWTGAPVGRNGFSWQRFALVWAAFVFVFFSVSGSKLPSYILPMFPALALTLGWQLMALPESTLARLTLPLVVIMGAITLIVLFAFVPLASRFADARQPLAPLLEYGAWLKTACIVAFAGGALGLVQLRAGKRTAAVLGVSLSSLLAAMLILTGHDTLAEARSAAPIVARIEASTGRLSADVPFYSVRMYDQTLPYYLGRTVIQVEHDDELAMGIASEPAKAIATEAEWLRRWNDGGQSYAIMQPDEYQRLKDQNVPMRELGRDPRRVIVSRQ
ncbi:MAG: glycosyltransferase family 39 protein [Pseudomonadota bacterium]|nr:glycosyltransferase family 39 protein [Pseudomonadota bacterium]